MVPYGIFHYIYERLHLRSVYKPLMVALYKDGMKMEEKGYNDEEEGILLLHFDVLFIDLTPK